MYNYQKYLNSHFSLTESIQMNPRRGIIRKTLNSKYSLQLIFNRNGHLCGRCLRVMNEKNPEEPIGPDWDIPEVDDMSLAYSLSDKNPENSDSVQVNSIFTFSSEKVLDLCKMGSPPPFLSNVHVLRPSEPEKMVFANESVCLCVCL